MPDVISMCIINGDGILGTPWNSISQFSSNERDQVLDS